MPKKRFGVLCLSISPEGKRLLNVPEKPPSGWIIVRMDIGQENPIASTPCITCKSLPLELEIRAIYAPFCVSRAVGSAGVRSSAFGPCGARK